MSQLRKKPKKLPMSKNDNSEWSKRLPKERISVIKKYSWNKLYKKKKFKKEVRTKQVDAFFVFQCILKRWWRCYFLIGVRHYLICCNIWEKYLFVCMHLRCIHANNIYALISIVVVVSANSVASFENVIFQPKEEEINWKEGNYWYTDLMRHVKHIRCINCIQCCRDASVFSYEGNNSIFEIA